MSGESLLLTGALVPGREAPTDVLLDASGVLALGPDAWVPPPQEGGVAAPRIVNVDGHLLLPAPAEPHAHLDKALLYERAANPPGDLGAAVEASRRLYPTMTPDDLRERALRALSIAVRRGVTLVRTHVNVEEGLGTTAIATLLDVAREVRGELDLEVVALTGFPVTGGEGATNRALLEEALALGADVVGGAPALDPRPAEAVRLLVAAAAAAGRPIDLHLDETLDPTSTTLTVFAGEVAAHGLGGRAVASHCVSLGQQDPEVVRETARMLVDTGIAVVTLPQTNLALQGLAHPTRTPRGTAPVRLLREAGVTVAGGGDNWRDMFNPVGRIDPLETASLLVSVLHLTPEDAYRCVSDHARTALGRPSGEIRVGAPAELLAVRAGSVAEAVADGSEQRTVIHAGRVVSRTRIVEEQAPGTWRSAQSRANGRSTVPSRM